MDPLSAISEELAEIDGKIADIFRAMSLEKIKDSNRQSRQLEELTDKMRECKRLIKELDREVKNMERINDPNTSRMVNEKKQSMIKELDSYVALKKQNIWGAFGTDMHQTLKTRKLISLMGRQKTLGNIWCAFGTDMFIKSVTTAMTNQQLMDNGSQMMDEIDQAIERSKKVVHETINVGTETTQALKAQTEHMSRIVNELDSIHFSIKKASKLVKEIGRQVATDRCIMGLLVLIVIGVVTIIIVKLVHPNNKNIPDIPGLAPRAMTRKLLWNPY